MDTLPSQIPWRLKPQALQRKHPILMAAKLTVTKKESPQEFCVKLQWDWLRKKSLRLPCSNAAAPLSLRWPMRHNGITSAQDNSDWEDFLTYEQMEKEGKLTLRISEWLPFDAPVE